jgi:glycerol uptake facilitator-like aquaporin
MIGPWIGRRAAAEALGTAFLLAAVVGSGIMAERLSGGNVALALLANSVATGGALIALILTFGPVSGAQLNPAVTLVLAARGALPWGDAAIFVAVQTIAAIAGVWLAHLMFGLPLIQSSVHARTGLGQWVGEFVATFGLIALILSAIRHNAAALPYAVAAYITAAYWFTSSTSFANPAVTVARSMTDTFAGIGPNDVVGFVIAQLIGAAAAGALMPRLLAGSEPPQ